MKNIYKFLSYAILVLFLGTLAYGQQEQPEQATVAFSNPSKPGILEVRINNGGITITGYNGKEVIVEARTRETKLSNQLDKELRERIQIDQERAYRVVVERLREKAGEKQKKVEGMKKIQPLEATGLTIEEANNRMEIGVSSVRTTVDLIIQVPFATSLVLSGRNMGDVKVEKVRGDIEVNHHNGALTLTEISGSVVAHTFNGDIEITFVSVDPKKSMSFSTWNGDIDITFPADVKANLKMNSERGDIYSDFDINIKPAVKKEEADNRDKGGKYRISFDKSMYGAVGGGGQEFQFKTYNGNIYIRKAK